MNLNEMPVSEAAARIRSGAITSEALVAACLDRIRKRDPDVQAWVHLDAEEVLRQARQRDREEPRGPLHGIPIGVKDIIDTFDMPTRYGSRIYEDHVPPWDAASVALAREAGAVIMGKTATTEFALRQPARTRNPHNLAHSPGGSSSGSAAAVADFMVPLSYGTQTGGSQIRPASYCGVVGYKPTFGLINVTGVKPLSPSNDTVGAYARSVTDVALFASAVSGAVLPDFGVCGGFRIGFCRTPQWSHAEEPLMRALEELAASLSNRGYAVVEVSLPPIFDDLLEAQEIVYRYEMYRSLSHERQAHPQLLSSSLRKILERAAEYGWRDYEIAHGVLAKCRTLMAEILDSTDALLAPSAPGEAPLFEDGTGDAIFNKIWTGLHLPAVSIPVFTGPSGLPMGAQLVGQAFGDAKLLKIADCVMRAVR